IHRLRPALEEFLYPAMEEFHVDVRIADGPHAQTIPMALERFTLIGATTRFGLLTPPMRARFGLVERLSDSPPADLAQSLGRWARIPAPSRRYTSRSSCSVAFWLARRAAAAPREPRTGISASSRPGPRTSRPSSTGRQLRIADFGLRIRRSGVQSAIHNPQSN